MFLFFYNQDVGYVNKKSFTYIMKKNKKKHYMKWIVIVYGKYIDYVFLGAALRTCASELLICERREDQPFTPIS